MSQSLVEETGKTARGLFEAMRESPVTLSLVLFNIVFLAVLYLSLTQERDFREKLLDEFVTANSRSQDMIYNCALGEKKPPPTQPQPVPPEVKRGPR